MLITVISIAAIVILVAVDFIIKSIVVNNLELYESVPAINGLLNWKYVTNSGASWGIFSGKTTFLVVITFILIAFIIWLLISGKITSVLCRISFILITAGGAGNLIDRVFNNGKVVDYIDISPVFNFPIFNFADCCITVGAALFCVYVIFFYDSKKEDNAEKQEENYEAV